MHRFIKELLGGEKVEYKPLEDVAHFQNGFAFKKNHFSQKGSPIIRIKNIQEAKVTTDDVVYFNKENSSENLKDFEIKKGDILLAMSGATTGKVGIYIEDEISYLNQRVGKITPNSEFLLNRFLYHFLLSKIDDIYSMAISGGAQPNLRTSDFMSKLIIPIPPLKIQEKIICILDNFFLYKNDLITNLHKELSLRQKQFNYYRNKMLTFDDNVEIKNLNCICIIKTGEMISKKIIENNLGEYPVINSGKEPLGFVCVYNTENDPLGITTRGAGVGSITWQEGRYFRGNLNYSITPKNEKILSRFLFHLLNNMQDDIHKLCTFNAIPALNASSLKELLVPIPTVEEQRKIINRLDKYDLYTKNIIKLLSDEIELREKQYNYYRDQLLNFNED